MGSGTGVKWVVILLIYFFFLTVAITSYVQGLDSMNIDHEISANNPYGAVSTTTDINDSEIGEVSTLFFPTTAWGNLKATFGLMTGFSADLGMPAIVRWIFSTLFFWLPLVMLVGGIIVIFRA